MESDSYDCRQACGELTAFCVAVLRDLSVPLGLIHRSLLLAVQDYTTRNFKLDDIVLHSVVDFDVELLYAFLHRILVLYFVLYFSMQFCI